MTQKTLTKEFDMRTIFAILAILIAIPYFYPLGLPLTLSRTTVAYAAVMEDLQLGDIIVISSDCTVGGLASVGGSIEVTLKYFVARARRAFLMVTFGAYMGTQVMSRFTLLAGRIEFVIKAFNLIAG